MLGNRTFWRSATSVIQAVSVLGSQALSLTGGDDMYECETETSVHASIQSHSLIFLPSHGGKIQ